jgi:hypothetical protein
MHVADLMEPGCLEDVYRSYEAVFWELWVKLFPYVGISLGCLLLVVCNPTALCRVILAFACLLACVLKQRQKASQLKAEA